MANSKSKQIRDRNQRKIRAKLRAVRKRAALKTQKKVQR